MQSNVASLALGTLLVLGCASPPDGDANGSGTPSSEPDLSQLEESARSRLETAISLERVVELEPENVEARMSLGLALFEFGDKVRGIEQLLEVVRLTPEDAQAHFELARLWKNAGGADMAIREFQEAIALDREHIDARLGLAGVLGATGKAAEALEQYDTVLELDPQNDTARLERPGMIFGTGGTRDGLAAMNALITGDPNAAAPRIAFGKLLLQMGNFQAAIDNFRKAIHLEGGPELQAKAWLYIGLTQSMQGATDEALQAYEQAQALDPDLTEARTGLAKLLQAAGRHEEAVREYEAMLNREPRNLSARLETSRALLLAGRSLDSRAILEAGLAAQPDDRELADALARVLASSPVDDLRDGRRALELAKRTFEATRGRAHAETLAMAHAEYGQFGEAIELQERLLADAEQRRATEDAARLRETLALYELRKPFRAPWPQL